MDPAFWSNYAFFLLIALFLAVGVTGAVARTWSLHRRVYSLEDRLEVIEGVQTREVKIRAAQSRPPKREADDALVAQLAALPKGAGGRKLNWWEKNQAKVS